HLGDERAGDFDVIEHEGDLDGMRRSHVPATFRRLPVESIRERPRSRLNRLAFRELSRVRAPGMIGRNQDPQIPRRGLRMCLAVDLDDTTGIAADALRRTKLQPGIVE